MATMDEFDEEIARAVENHMEYAGYIFKFQIKIKKQIAADNEALGRQSYTMYPNFPPFDLSERNQHTLSQAKADLYKKVIPAARQAEALEDFKIAGFDKGYISPKEKKQIRQEIALKAQKRKEQERRNKFNSQNIPSHKAWNDRKAMEVVQDRMSGRMKSEKAITRLNKAKQQSKTQEVRTEKPQTAERRMFEKLKADHIKRMQENTKEITKPQAQTAPKEDAQNQQTVERRSLENLKKQSRQNANEITIKPKI